MKTRRAGRSKQHEVECHTYNFLTMLHQILLSPRVTERHKVVGYRWNGWYSCSTLLNRNESVPREKSKFPSSAENKKAQTLASYSVYTFMADAQHVNLPSTNKNISKTALNTCILFMADDTYDRLNTLLLRKLHYLNKISVAQGTLYW